MNSRTYNQNKRFETKELLQLSFFGVIASISVISVFLFTWSTTTPVVTIQTPSVIQNVPENPFDTITLKATAAVIYHPASKKFIYTKNADAPLALASITKIMTALVAAEHIEQKPIIPISADALATEGDSGLLLGEYWDLKNLIDYMLVVSSNDGATAIALAIGNIPLPAQGDGTPVSTEDPLKQFLSLMNQTADRLNLRNMHFNNPSGLDTGTEQGGSYGSAKEVALLMSYVIDFYPNILTHTKKATSTIASEQFLKQAINTNPYVEAIPGIIGSKTGFTDIAGGNLVIAFDIGINEPIIAVVLGSTADGRFTDIMELVKATRAWFTHSNVYPS